MGLEVGWHLRFTNEGELEFLVDRSALPQAKHALYSVSDWSLDVEEDGDSARVRFKRAPRADGAA